MSPVRTTPRQKESRSFGKGTSVPFETLALRAGPPPRNVRYPIDWPGGGIGRSRGEGGGDDSFSRLLFPLVRWHTNL